MRGGSDTDYQKASGVPWGSISPKAARLPQKQAEKRRSANEAKAIGEQLIPALNVRNRAVRHYSAHPRPQLLGSISASARQRARSSSVKWRRSPAQFVQHRDGFFLHLRLTTFVALNRPSHTIALICTVHRTLFRAIPRAPDDSIRC